MYVSMCMRLYLESLYVESLSFTPLPSIGVKDQVFFFFLVLQVFDHFCLVMIYPFVLS